MRIAILSIFNILLFMLASCNLEQSETADNQEKKAFQEEKNLVEVIILEKKVFAKELISNGKLKAIQKSKLQFETSEKLSHLYVKNGSVLKKGAIIAILATEKTNQQLQQTKLQFQKTELNREELLIGQGYSSENILAIPPKIIEIANIRSGYSSAQHDLQLAQYKLNALTLTAPFAGIIANLESKIYENINSGDDFCTLIDDRNFEVEFSLLEKEIMEISLQQKIQIRPFSTNKNYTGFISEINPMVAENGMIKVKAQISNAGDLLDGMNVEVIIEYKVMNQLIVPKTAVVLRQNKEVLFRLINGKAFWTYVITEYENSNSYAVIANITRGAELHEGDTVIVSGNLNLAHDSNVEIENQ